MAQSEPVVLENVNIIFRNFAGAETQYNKEGDRNFGVILEDHIADAMEADGWNIKTLKLREDADEGEVPKRWLPVTVAWPKPGQRSEPPQCYLVTSRGKTKVKEDEAELIDYAEITNVDLIVRPYDWEVNGKTGRKAYLKSIYVTIVEDPLALKYADPAPEPTGELSY